MIQAREGFANMDVAIMMPVEVPFRTPFNISCLEEAPNSY